MVSTTAIGIMRNARRTWQSTSPLIALQNSLTQPNIGTDLRALFSRVRPLQQIDSLNENASVAV